MADHKSPFALPPVTNKSDGSPRQVGFELEFSGVSLEDASRAVEGAVAGERVTETSAEHVIESPELGRFTVEIDWSFLKRKAEEVASGELEGEWVAQLSRAAPLLVPIEVVCPPIAVHGLHRLAPLTDALRDAGAVGTEESLIAAYGVHINPELPALDAQTIGRYLRAFALMQWWLIDAHEVDTMRRLTPYIDPYPEAYLKAVLADGDMPMERIFSDYLKHNATRNRALDLLPLLAEIDEAQVRAAVDDPRIKARPTFHYRLPNCQIERADWSLATSWNTWCIIERLAGDEDALSELATAFFDADRPLIGLQRSAWVSFMDQWLHDHALV